MERSTLGTIILRGILRNFGVRRCDCSNCTAQERLGAGQLFCGSDSTSFFQFEFDWTLRWPSHTAQYRRRGDPSAQDFEIAVSKQFTNPLISRSAGRSRQAAGLFERFYEVLKTLDLTPAYWFAFRASSHNRSFGIALAITHHRTGGFIQFL